MKEAKHPLAYAPRYLVFFLKLFPHFSPSSFLKLLSLFPQACPFLERLSCPPKIFSLSPFNTFPPAFFSHFHLFSSSSSLYSLSYVASFSSTYLASKRQCICFSFAIFFFLLCLTFLLPLSPQVPFSVLSSVPFSSFLPVLISSLPLLLSSLRTFCLSSLLLLYLCFHQCPLYVLSPFPSCLFTLLLKPSSYFSSLCVLFLCVPLLSFLLFLSFDSCPSPLPFLPPASSPLPRTTPVLYP